MTNQERIQARKQARILALEEVINLLGFVGRGHSVDWGHNSNQFVTDKQKKAIDREIEEIRFQLEKRRQKLAIELFAANHET